MSLRAVTPAPSPTSADAEVREIIAGRVGADRIRQFLLEQAPIESTKLQLLRSRLKPGRKLVAFYEVDRGPIAVTWSEGSPMQVFVAPHDPAFPQLARIYDAGYMAGLMESAFALTTSKRLTVTPVRYRPGQRHVLRIDDPESSERWYAKTYRDDTGALAVAKARSFQAALSAWGGPARTARPYGHVAPDNLALWADSGGETLSRVISCAPDAARTAGSALRALHRSSTTTPGANLALGVTDVAKEGRATVRAVEHVEVLLPATGKRLRQLLATAVGSLMDLPDEAGYSLHGDFKCDNILTGEDGLTLLDFDRATIGDPALDLGKFCADLQWWAMQAGLPADELVAAFTEGYGECPPLRWERARHFDLLFRLRAAGRRVAIHDEGWAERVDACVENAATREGSQR